MKITSDDIKYVAKLARLTFQDDEIEAFTTQMADIIGYVDKLNELETTGVKPMEHVIPMHNVLRADEKGDSYKREEILKNAPDRTEECFKVPKIVE